MNKYKAVLIIGVLMILLQPFGGLTISRASSIPGNVGYLEPDANPTQGALAQFGNTGAASFGTMTMSIGVDLGATRPFNEIRLTDSKEWNAVTEAELTVYVSDTNDGTEDSYRPVTGWTFHKEGSLILLDGFHETGRYVKVHGRFAPGAGEPLTQISLQAVMSVHFTPGHPAGPATRIQAATMGYVNNDSDGTQAVGSWAYKGAAAMDYQNRSVGINLGSPTRVSQLELADSNTDSRGTLADYKLYYSDDNAAWTPVEMSGVRFDSRMEQGRTLHRFTFPPVKAQFFKVNSLYSDSSWKWQLTNLQRDVKAYGPGSELGGQLGFTRIGYLDEDVSPENSPMRNWGHSADLALDYNGRSLGMDMGSIKTVGAVTLTDSNSAARGDKTSYSVYTSSDDSRYTLLPSEQIRWNQTLIDNRLVYTIGFEQPVTARYLKIHTNYRDTDFSFVLSGAARSQIRVYAPPAANQPGPADPTRLETPYPIGSATQLFVSRDLVESANQVSWQVIAGQKSPDPIIEVGPGDEWRYIMGGDVIYNANESDTKFEMWYMVQNTNNNSISSYYAKSPDGLHWQRSPDYKLTVNGTPFSAYSASVRKDPDAPAAERYKMAMFNFASSAGQYYTSTLVSPNGIEWTYKNQRAVLGYDFAITVWDRFRQEYVMMTKSNESDPGFGNRLRRIFHTSTSPDFEQWTPTIKSLEADAIDNNFASIAERYDRAKPLFETPLDRGFMRADIYATAFYPHESGMIGFPLVHYINNKNPQKGDDDGVSEVQLAFSRDQHTWQRDFREPVLPTGTARIRPDLPDPLPRDNAAVSDWDSGWMYTAMHALDVGNEVWMYYNGSNTTHAADAIYNSAWRYDPDTNPSGVYTWEIGLAKWQKDRFVSVHTPASGTLTTKPVLFEGNTLVINARTGAGGSVRAEILDRENRVLVPLSEAVTGDTFTGMVRFAGEEGALASLAGKPVKVKFYLENAELFSYGFKPDSTPPVTKAELQGPKQTSWYMDDVTVTLSAADDFSGVDHTEYSLDEGKTWSLYSTPIRITEDGRHTLLYRSKDGAGNAEAVQAADIPIDKTPPDIQLTGAAIYTVDQQVRITCTARDTVSGVVYSSCSSPLIDSPAYRLGIGTHRVEAMAVDEAGHRVTEAAEYEIQVSVPSMIRLLKQWAGEGLNAGVANSLMGKLEHGQTDAFLHEVSAQKGKNLSDEQAEALAAMALALTSQPNGMGPDNPA